MRLPRHVLPPAVAVAAAAPPAAARCRRRHSTDLFYHSSILHTCHAPALPLCGLAVDDATTLRCSRFASVINCAVALDDFGLSACGLHGRCVFTPFSFPSPPSFSHTVCTENCQVICQLRLCMQITFATAPDEHCISFRMHDRGGAGKGGGCWEWQLQVVTRLKPTPSTPPPLSITRARMKCKVCKLILEFR